MRASLLSCVVCCSLRSTLGYTLYPGLARHDRADRLRKAILEDEATLLAVHYQSDGPHRTAVNLTCMRPADHVRAEDGQELFNDELLALPLQPGRSCKDGTCTEDCCSRVFLRQFMNAEEVRDLRRYADTSMPPETQNELRHFLDLKAAAESVQVTGTPSDGFLLYLKLVERMRRALAHEYGLPLLRLSPKYFFLSRTIAPDDIEQLDVGELHTDECSVAAYHYSGICYLDTAGDAFTGGSLCFVDDGVRRQLAPVAGQAAVFSSGWENIHHVGPVLSGTRFAMPMFFTTQPGPEPLPETATLDGRTDAMWRLIREGAHEELLARWAELFES